MLFQAVKKPNLSPFKASWQTVKCQIKYKKPKLGLADFYEENSDVNKPLKV